jgi:hypothetical protein
MAELQRCRSDAAGSRHVTSRHRSRRRPYSLCLASAAIVLGNRSWTSTFVPLGHSVQREEDASARQAYRNPSTQINDSLDSVSLSRRDLAGTMIGLTLLLGAGLPACAAFYSSMEQRPFPPPIPPKPSKNAFIRKMQVESWRKEPFARMQDFINAMNQNFIITQGFFAERKIVHWGPGPEVFKFDVLDKDNFNEAARLGKVLKDSDMTSVDQGIEVYVYANDEARDYCQKQLQIQDVIEIPYDLQDNIKAILQTPFPEFIEPLAKPIAAAASQT